MCRPSSCCVQLEGTWGSVVAAPQAQLRLMGPECLGSLAVVPGLAHGICNLPGPEIETLSSVLAGRFLSTVPPGNSFPVVTVHLLLDFQSLFIAKSHCIIIGTSSQRHNKDVCVMAER